MERHKKRRNQAQADDLGLLHSLLSRGLNQNDEQLLYVMLTQPAQTPLVTLCAPQPARRHPQRARMALRTTSAALLVGGALALGASNTALFTPTAQAQPAAVSASAQRAAVATRVSRDDTLLLQALLSSSNAASHAPTRRDADTLLLRALLSRPSAPRVAGLKEARLLAMRAQQSADRAAKQLDRVDTLRAEQIREARELAQQRHQAAANADLAATQIADAQLIVGETLVIPAGPQATSDMTLDQQISSYYIVRPGDTLWGIAAHFYGNGNLWWSIFQANTTIISNPNLIYPDQRLAIPVNGTTQPNISTSGITTQSVPASPPNPIGQGIGQYTVVSGDTLSDIAFRAYNNAYRWPAIFAANPQISNADLIFPGQVLTIPR